MVLAFLFKYIMQVIDNLMRYIYTSKNNFKSVGFKDVLMAQGPVVKGLRSQGLKTSSFLWTASKFAMDTPDSFEEISTSYHLFAVDFRCT